MRITKAVVILFILCAILPLYTVPAAAEEKIHLPQSVSLLKDDLTASDLQIINVKKIKRNLFCLTIKRGDRIFRAKWKLIGQNCNESEGRRGNNAPRCETAAYWLNESIWGEANTQQHLVPLVIVRAFHINLPTCNKACKDILPFNKVYQFASFPDINDHLVVGALSYWVEDVTYLDNFAFGKKPYFFDKQRMKESPAYRRAFSDTNLFAYLIQHGDANYSRNFLITRPDYKRIFMVDNGYSFDGEKFYYRHEWYGLRRYNADDLTAQSFSRKTAQQLNNLDVYKLKRRMRITALINLDTGETILNPPDELTDKPLAKNKHFKRNYKGVYTGYWQGHNWAAWCIEEPGIKQLFVRIKKMRQLLGTRYPLFP